MTVNVNSGTSVRVVSGLSVLLAHRGFHEIRGNECIPGAGTVYIHRHLNWGPEQKNNSFGGTALADRRDLGPLTGPHRERNRCFPQTRTRFLCKENPRCFFCGDHVFAQPPTTVRVVSGLSVLLAHRGFHEIRGNECIPGAGTVYIHRHLNWGPEQKNNSFGGTALADRRDLGPLTGPHRERNRCFPQTRTRFLCKENPRCFFCGDHVFAQPPTTVRPELTLTVTPRAGAGGDS